MTTPAINVTNLTLESQPNHQTNKPCGGSASTTTQPGTAINLRRSESRPASINHPKDRGTGWRDPTAWNHSKIVDNPNPKCSVKCWTTLPSGGCAGGSYVSYDNGMQWTLTGTALPAFPSYLEGRAVSRALLKLKHSSVNLAVAFAERRQTMEMFSGTVRGIANSVKSYKRAHPREWGNVVRGNWKNSPNSWLALQYGWKPLISDLQGACETMSNHQNSLSSYLAKVSGVSGEDTTLKWNKTMNLSTLYRFAVTDRWKHRCRAVLYYRLRDPRLATFASLGLTNPFELAWEKLKYSFVIDWFLPVGNWLSALDADFGWDFYSGTLTKFSRGGSDSNFVTTGFAPGHFKVDFSGSYYKSEGFSMTRTVYSNPPWGGIPRFKNPLSSQHIANAMSLLVQAFRR